MTLRSLIAALALVAGTSGCVSTAEHLPAAAFDAPATGAATPWTHARFDDKPGKFTFAVHSDLTGGERDGVFAVAIAQLNLLRPEFIINVGDLIEGSTDEAEVDRQWDAYDARVRKARAPVFYVAGNHDRVGAMMQAVWDRRLGPGYYHFRYKDALFLVLDTEDNTPERTREIFEMREYALQFARSKEWDRFRETPYATMPENLAGNITDAQSRYMIDAINAHSDVRHTFLFTHKAPWLREDLSAFAAIEAALAGRPYTLFHGHEHSYRHERRNGGDYIRLATTGGVQLPDGGRSMDHVTLVTVDDDGVSIANVLLDGILDKTGNIPLDGDRLCFETARCAPSE
ncbi:MAG: metallophosphoesterase family protein [Pseudomonadota bacterium]